METTMKRSRIIWRLFGYLSQFIFVSNHINTQKTNSTGNYFLLTHIGQSNMVFLTGIVQSNIFFVTNILRILNKNLMFKLKSVFFKLLATCAVVLEPCFIIYVRIAPGETIPLIDQLQIIIVQKR